MSACGARNRAGGHCGQPALAGMRVCRYHGGASPQARQKAHLRLVERQALAVIDREGIVPMTDALTALQQLSGEALRLKSYFGERLAALEQIRYEGRSGEQLRSEVALFERALDRAQRFALDLAKLDIDERLARVSERQGEMLAACVERALGSCGLEDRADLRHAIAGELRLVGAES
ncbi:MAG: HGGxSTG domain-containing protein [Candidatus Dormibacteria bacterium]